jgi:hypothetical protein
MWEGKHTQAQHAPAHWIRVKSDLFRLQPLRLKHVHDLLHLISAARPMRAKVILLRQQLLRPFIEGQIPIAWKSVSAML